MNVTALRRDFEHPLDADPARAGTLPARYYLDPEVFEQEKEAISTATGITPGTSRNWRTPATT